VITVCDLTGTGVQDTAIATLACRRAAVSGAGVALSPDRRDHP
jgi:ornithine cyclodeaminase